VPPVQSAQGQRQLVEASAGVFASGAPRRREREQDQLVEQLYPQSGQLQVEVDWLRKKGRTRLSNSGR